MWRLRYALRKARLRLVRFAAHSSLARALSKAALWLVIAALVGGAVSYAVRKPETLKNLYVRGESAARGLLEAGWRLAAGQGVIHVNADSGRSMLQAVLPPLGGSATGPEPVGSWRTPLRAWVFVATGYDFTSPRTFLESEIPGFRSAVERRRDVVLLPGKESDGADIPQVEDEPGAGAAYLSPSLEEGSAREGAEPETPPGEEFDDPTGEAGIEAPPREERPPLPAGPAPALAALSREEWGREPLVLILHSHTSESYRTSPPDPRATELNHIHNSSDTGIVRVGRALAQKLQDQYGIPSIHSTRIHNWPHHARAYLNSRETVQDILQEHPSIKVVLDIHRQGVPNFTYATTVSDIDAVGIDIIYTTGLRAGYSNPHWRSNEAFAMQLAEAMEALHPGLLRRVMKIDDSVYNQDLHPRMLLLEIGNYLDFEEHALAAAQLLADPLARVLHELLAEERQNEAAPALTRAIAPLRPPSPVPLRRLETQPGR